MASNTKGFKYKGVERRNEERQVKKNQEDINAIINILKDGIFQLKLNFGQGLEYDEETQTLTAVLNSVIDDELNEESENPVQNKVITLSLKEIRHLITNLTTAVSNNSTNITNLNNNKAANFTVGDGLEMTSQRQLKNTRLNTYPKRIYDAGLLITNAFSEQSGDILQKIFVPYLSKQQAGVVTYKILSQLVKSAIEENIPELISSFIPQPGQIEQTIDANYNPNEKYANTTWRKFKDGIYFSSGTTFEYKKQQVPNITAEINNINARGSSAQTITRSGALKKTIKSNGNNIGCGTPVGDVIKDIIFDASDSNSVYVNNGVVRPNTISTYSWIRVDSLAQEVLDALEPYLQEQVQE